MASEDRIELPSELIDRGVAWQVLGFVLVGIAATSALAIYSETDTLAFRFFEVAATKVNWAFVPTIAFIIDRSRKMFERSSEIRAAARREVRERGRQEGREEARKETEDRIRSILKADGIVIPPDTAEKAFGDTNREKP